MIAFSIRTVNSIVITWMLAHDGFANSHNESSSFSQTQKIAEEHVDGASALLNIERALNVTSPQSDLSNKTLCSNNSSKFIGSEIITKENKSCLDKHRLDTLFQYYSLYSPTDRASRFALLESENTLRRIVADEENFILRFNQSGSFTGVVDAVEYVTLSHPDVNGGHWEVDHLTIKSISCLSNDELKIETEIRVKVREMGEFLDPSHDKAVFEPDGSSALISVDTTVPDSITDLMRRSPYDQRNLCETAILRCPGKLYPYKDLEECYKITSHIPQICEGPSGNFIGGVLQGDTMACRYLHLLSSSLRPVHHCPHLRDISEKCIRETCPSAVRLKDPVKLDLEFDAGNISQVRTLEIILLAMIFAFPIFGKIWHWNARRSTSFVFKDASSENEDESAENNSTTGPSVVFDDLHLLWKSIPHHRKSNSRLVISMNQGYLGGCKITGITGDSGSGKTSFIKLICGFNIPHMELSVAKWRRRDPMALSAQQSGEIWPLEMPVKDILLFACALAKVEPSQYFECFKTLGIIKFLDQPFGTLSGGQKQRVNVAATIVRPNPTVIFLDEPLASLDEENALNCLSMLKELQGNHSFVLTVHRPSERMKHYIDRMLYFDVRTHTLEEVFSSIPSTKHSNMESNFRDDQHEDEDDDCDYDKEEHSKPCFFGSFRASLILWYGQFYGLPVVEVIIFFATVSGAVLVGMMARKSTVEWDSPYMPTDESVRIPFYLADILVGMAVMASFGVSLIYANREKKIIEHFVALRIMSPSSYVGTSLMLRSMFHGILQGAAWVLISIPLMGLPTEKLDIILVNTAIFCLAWGSATFSIAFIVPGAYSSHIIMLMDVVMIFFSGVFFYWSRLFQFFRVLHYINPLFYILSANAFVLLVDFDSGCDEIQHPGNCVSGLRILEMDDIQPFTSLAAQGYNLLFLSFYLALSWFVLSPKSIPREPKRPLSILEKKQNSEGIMSSCMPSRRGSGSTRHSFLDCKASEGFISVQKVGGKVSDISDTEENATKKSVSSNDDTNGKDSDFLHSW